MIMKNDYNLEIRQTGYGHWRITTTHYGKDISCTTTNSKAIDDYNSEDGERDRGRLRKKQGYELLRLECIRANSK